VVTEGYSVDDNLSNQQIIALNNEYTQEKNVYQNLLTTHAMTTAGNHWVLGSVSGLALQRMWLLACIYGDNHLEEFGYPYYLFES
jgi:hypothetical protein